MEAQVVTVDAGDTVREAARRMRSADIGDVIVLEHGRLQGVLTDRDIVVRVVAEERDSEVTVCGQVSSREVHCVAPETPVAEALTLMRRHALRRLPVVDGDHVSGVISLADIAVDRDPESVLASISGAPSSD
ncbi:MAG: CBS domain-containing protein [Candidatus Aeolococcus gillhamiae]|uniref:CBS domain-containing protein n=1 Tax=Candidatus Aeolococcus gillhamiae TaxID=3127015 RepID=A0A2W5ZDH1_9BACT|nr:MAG: CBS domain-containing protein [Candidatus Dormibacter sp. RRmetagenome_bin12]